MFGIWDLPADLCGCHFPALVRKETHTYTYSSSLSGQTHPPLSRVSVCLRVHACVLTVARQTVNRQHCLMPVCDSVCLLWVCLSLCVRICVLVWGRGSLSETETKRAFLFTLELGKGPDERLWIWWGGTLEPSSVSHTEVGLYFSQGWASITAPVESKMVFFWVHWHLFTLQRDKWVYCSHVHSWIVKTSLICEYMIYRDWCSALRKGLLDGGWASWLCLWRFHGGRSWRHCTLHANPALTWQIDPY